MFNTHLLKILGGFCVMILIGLISLVILDSYKQKGNTPSSGTAITVPNTKSQSAAEAKKAPAPCVKSQTVKC